MQACSGLTYDPNLTCDCSALYLCSLFHFPRCFSLPENVSASSILQDQWKPEPTKLIPVTSGSSYRLQCPSLPLSGTGRKPQSPFFLCQQFSADVTSFTALDKWEQHRKHPQPVLNQLSCGSVFLFFFVFLFLVVSAFHMLKCVDEIQTANVSNPAYLQGAGLQSRVRPLPHQHSSLVNILVLPCSSFPSSQQHSFRSTSSN